MENNIFFKSKKNKFNPDIEPKLKNKEVERDNTKFILSNNIYNPVTGNLPSQINSSKDLVLEKEQPISKPNIQKLIMDKEKERQLQDNNYKPIKTKVVNNVSQPQQHIQTQQTQQINHNYIETHDELKRGGMKPKTVIRDYDNILGGLKDLGIIK
jgi:hypothetical protein